MPVNTERVEDGSFALRRSKVPGGPLTAHYLSKQERAQQEASANERGWKLKLYESHFSTCPEAEKWRKK